MASVQFLILQEAVWAFSHASENKQKHVVSWGRGSELAQYSCHILLTKSSHKPGGFKRWGRQISTFRGRQRGVTWPTVGCKEKIRGCYCKRPTFRALQYSKRSGNTSHIMLQNIHCGVFQKQRNIQKNGRCREDIMYL